MAGTRRTADGAQEPPRLSPAMASTRLLVLRFVRDYIGEWGESPSQGEIRNGLDITRTAVRNALRSLAGDGLILLTPGHRGIRLPSEREAALRVLEALGYTILERERAVTPDADGPNSPLLRRVLLDYPDSGLIGDRSGDNKGEGGSAEAG